MLNKEQMERYLTYAMDSAADYAEIYEEREHTETIKMLDGKVEQIEDKTIKGIGIRLLKGTESVYAYSNRSDEETVMPLLKDLKTAIGASSDTEAAAPVVLEKTEIKTAHPVRIDAEAASLQEKQEILIRADAAAREAGDKIFKVEGTLLNVHQDVQISTSEGRLVEDTRVRTRLVVMAYAKDGDNIQYGSARPGGSMGLEFYDNERPEKAGREASRVALVNLKAVDCPSGKMPVVIDNAFGGVIFHEACGHALEATSVSKGQSIFSGKKGTKIAADCVSAVDDGTIPGGWGSENVDDEGTPQARRQLIKDGVLTSYMIDILGGRRMGEASTGSSRRESYKFQPTSRMSNTFILEGKDSFESLFEGIEKGLYARKMGGGSVNPQTGDFNFAVLEGYLIENGKVTKPVRGAALIGNGKDILKNIERISDNLERDAGMCGSVSGSIPADVGQPALRVSSITVGGTANE